MNLASSGVCRWGRVGLALGGFPWHQPALRSLVVASPVGVPMADVLRLPWTLVSGPQGSLCPPCPNNLSSCQGVGLATSVSLLALQVPMGALSVVCNLGTPRVPHEALMHMGQAKPTEAEWLLPRSLGESSPNYLVEVVSTVKSLDVSGALCFSLTLGVPLRGWLSQSPQCRIHRVIY